MPSPSHTASNPVEKYLHGKEFEIRAGLKRVYSENRFSLSALKRCQLSNVALLSGSEFEFDQTLAFHPTWRTINLGRRSAACLLEQFRARIWALGALCSALGLSRGELAHVTFANTNDRRPAGVLSTFRLSTRKRQITSLLNDLRREHPSLWSVGMFEVSASNGAGDGFVFEPHMHLLVSGIPIEALRAGFAKIVPQGSFGHPLQVKVVPSSKDAEVLLSYFCKFFPEVRTTFLTANGRSGKGKRNRMAGPLLAEWLAWMAGVSIDELLIRNGVPAEIMRDFRTAELQPIVRRFLETRLKQRG